MARLGRLPAAAAVDFLDAWEHDRLTDQTQAVWSHAWGPRASAMPLALAVACGALPLTRGLTEPEQMLTLGGLAFAGIAAWRLGGALRKADEVTANVLRGVLAGLAPALLLLVFIQTTAAESLRLAAWWVSTPPAALPESLLQHGLDVALGAAGKVAWTTVLVATFMSTRKWVSALIELVVASLVLGVTLALARMIGEFLGDLVRAVLGAMLSGLGLGFLSTVLDWLDTLADAGFVALVCGWVLAACWLVAGELLPRALRGEHVRFVDTLSRVVQHRR